MAEAMDKPETLAPPSGEGPGPGDRDQPAPPVSALVGGLGWALTAAIAFAICAALLAADHFLLPPPVAKFGRVDLARLMAEQQRDFAELVAKGEGERAYDQAARTGKGLSQAVRELARECGCAILVSDAVVAGAEDLTPRLREIVHGKIERLILALRPKVGVRAYATLVWAAIRRHPIAWGAFALFAAAGFAFSHFYWLRFTLTESMPYHLVLVEKTPPAPGSLKRGDMVAWRWPGGLIYPEGAVFLKVVKGLPGDRVTRRRPGFLRQRRIPGAGQASLPLWPQAGGEPAGDGAGGPLLPVCAAPGFPGLPLCGHRLRPPRTHHGQGVWGFLRRGPRRGRPGSCWLSPVWLSPPGPRTWAGSVRSIPSPNRTCSNSSSSRLQAKQASGELARIEREFLERSRQAIESPRPVAGLVRTRSPRTFYFDPSITVPETVRDPDGKVLVAAGTRVNPLDFVALSNHLIFFDARDRDQARQALALRDHYQGRVHLILTGGSYIDFMKRFDVRVYFDQQGLLVRRLGIRQVPALVTQEGKRLRIDELEVGS